MDIKFSGVPSYQALENITSELKTDFGDDVSEPVYRDYGLEYIFTMGNVLIFLVIILSAVNFLYIYSYILEKRKRQYRVFMLCGCSANKTLLFAAAEILLCALVYSLLGIVIFHFAIRPLVVSLEPLLKYSFHQGVYLGVTLASVMISFMVLILEFIFLHRRKGEV